jgi:Zn-dependent alcohol dehydrogenase
MSWAATTAARLAVYRSDMAIALDELEDAFHKMERGEVLRSVVTT